MATNQDFDDLIVRIDVATTTLENSIAVIEQGADTVEQAVIDAQAAAAQSLQQAQAAANSAGESQQALTDALQAVAEAEALVAQLEDSVILQDAPEDGLQYVRQDGEWAVNSGSVGTVTSVNNQLPDSSGNVQLTIPAQVQSDWTATSGPAFIRNKPTLFDGNYNSLTNKPTIPQQGILSVVAGDNVTVDNSDPLRPVVSSSGGGGELGYPTGASSDVFYNNAPFTHWPNLNPFTPALLSQVSVNVFGNTVTGGNTITNKSALQALPEGWYWWAAADFTTLPTGFPNYGSVFIGNRRNNASGKFAIVYGFATGTNAPKMFISNPPPSGPDVVWHEYH